jgi:hypothetical protein
VGAPNAKAAAKKLKFYIQGHLQSVFFVSGSLCAPNGADSAFLLSTGANAKAELLVVGPKAKEAKKSIQIQFRNFTRR